MALTRENVEALLRWIAERLHEEPPADATDTYEAVCAGVDMELASKAAVAAVAVERHFPTADVFALHLIEARRPLLDPPPRVHQQAPIGRQEAEPTPWGPSPLDAVLPGWREMKYQDSARELAERIPRLPRGERIMACREMEKRWPSRGWGDEADREERRR